MIANIGCGIEKERKKEDDKSHFEDFVVLARYLEMGSGDKAVVFVVASFVAAMASSVLLLFFFFLLSSMHNLFCFF